MRHGKRTVEFVSVGLSQLEEPQQQLEKVLRTIGFHFQADRIAPTRAP